MNIRTQEKRAKNRFRKLFAYLMDHEMGVRVKPARLTVKQNISEDEVTVTGIGQGYALTIHFTKGADNDRKPVK